MSLEIRDLRILRAIADTGSLSGAARALGMSQGTISRGLQRIERATGQVAFRRHPHGATPTAAGRLMLSGADSLLPLVDQLLAAAGNTGGAQIAETFGIGAVPNPVLPVIAGAVNSLLHAPIALLTDDSNSVLVGMIRTGRLELAVLRRCPCPGASPPGFLGTAVITDERLLAGVSAHHRLAGRRSVTIADLAPEACVGTEARHIGLRRHFLAAFARGGFHPKLRCAADEAEATALACAAGAVLLAYPSPAPVPGIVYVPLEDAATRFQLYLAWPRDGRIAEHAPQVAEMARRAYP